MLTDTHAHLDYPDFAGDLDEVIRRAAAAGVKRIVTIGTSIEGSRRAIALAEKYAAVWAVVGVHPNDALKAPDDVITPLRELARHRRVVAIGETGLDYHHLPSRERRETLPAWVAEQPHNDPAAPDLAMQDGRHKNAQAILFAQQLDLAAELGLNVVIHQRDAWEPTLETLRPYGSRLRAVFHCFGGSLAQAREVIALGHLVSFTGIVTFKNARTVQEAAAAIPRDSFMVETDCPFLAPAPHRGKRCEPAHTRLTAEHLARLRGVPLDHLADDTTRTASAFFRFEH